MRLNLLFILLLQLSAPSWEAHAETRSSLFLHAYVPPTLSTKLVQRMIGSNQSLFVLSSQNNMSGSFDTQRVELEGLDQTNLKYEVKRIVTNDRIVRYEIFISGQGSSQTPEKPVLLKISAN